MNAETRVTDFYDDRYFDRLKHGGSFAGKAHRFLFEPYVSSRDQLIEFGCGDGMLLEQFPCVAKIGVEINPAARRAAAERGITLVAGLEEIPDEWATVLISNHALEHTYDPFEKAKLMLRKLAPNGVAVVVVPCERHDTPYREDDPDRHLFTWAPANLGILFRMAGFDIESCARIVHRWPPRAMTVQRWLGWRGFHAAARLWARLFPRLSQVRIVARKPGAA